ncbi:DUF4040 domain-containing protein [Halotia branconii]|uniref:DUF4040 domain-containing protein n=1 Tax=Halotia branconii CENA392 TaxID=1539056 RepID=A0AAJ6NS02_9CYAN|nr:DUF4040 domain-containing protein [Halotia branconii]WGV25532.1 DUF4040 domain-containing protein [Halotia branconii CENA392]
MNDNYIYFIVALLPLAACMLVFQVNPYHALVIRGILGAIAALVYTVLGAADVALTEALVGTMLAITLYAVAVRSSLVMRLGVLKDEVIEEQLMDDFRTIFGKYHLRLELITYKDTHSLHQALMDKEVHATCVRSKDNEQEVFEERQRPYHTKTRIQRLYDIMQTELVSPATNLIMVSSVINTPSTLLR